MKVKKIITRIKRKFIFLLDGVNTSKYVKKYDKWLKKNGVNIKGNIKYIHHSVFLDGTDYSKIHLGNNIVMSLDCILLVHDFSLEAGMLSVGKGSKDEAHYIKDVYIGDNCFIGARVTILCGTEIGDNCIVGAGAVLPGKKYPSGSIIAGNPARVIGNTKEWTEDKIRKNDYLRGFYN